MLKNNTAGKVLGIGYVPGKSATLVRNPNWNAKHRLPPGLPERNRHQDRRHASRASAARCSKARTSSRTSRWRSPTVKLAAEKYKSQLEISPGARRPLHRRQQQGRPVQEHQPAQGLLGGARPRGDGQGARRRRSSPTSRRTSSTRRSPASNRPAALAGPKVRLQRTPRRQHGGRRKVHEAGGLPERQIHRHENRPDRRREGSPPEQEDAEIVNQTLKNLGFKTKFTLVEIATMYAKYCDVSQRRDRRLPERRLDRRLRRPADGAQRHVQRQARSSRPATSTGARSNVPKINAAMAAAELVVARKRARRRGPRSTTNSSKTPPRSRSTGTRQPRHRGQATSHGVATLLERGRQWDYSFTLAEVTARPRPERR